MGNYTPQQCVAIVLKYAQNNNSIIGTQSEFRRQFPGRNPPLPPTVRQLMARFKEERTTSDKLQTRKPRA